MDGVASILVTSFVSLFRTCAIPSWLQSGNLALLLRIVCVSGMLAPVPWVPLGPEKPGTQFGMAHDRDKDTKDIIKMVPIPSAFPYAPDV